MALADKKYERIFSKTGSDADLVSTETFDEMKKSFDENTYLNDVSQLSTLGPVLYQLQQMQDELDALRTEISSNKDKTTFPGFGTSNSTALVGDTKLISIGTNTTVSFGDMVFTTVKGKTTHSIVMTVAYTDPSSSKVTTKTTTLTLA